MKLPRLTRVLTLVTVGLIGVAVGLHTGTSMVVPHMQQAIEECVGEVEKGCPLLYNYTLDLERENARLNLAVRTILTDGDNVCPIPTGEGEEE